MEVAAFEDPPAACEADAQVFLIRDPSGWDDFDVELEDRLRGGIDEAAVTIREYLQKLRR